MSNLYNPYEAPRAGVMDAPRAQGLADGDLPESVVTLLRQTRPWVLFLAILGFLGAGFCALAGLFVAVAGGVGGRMPAALGLVYFVIAALYVFPSLHLLRFSSSIQRLVNDPRMTRLEVALGHQKDFWRFVGLCAIVVMGLYALIIVGAMVFGMMKAMR
jgi:hypothetical protein